MYDMTGLIHDHQHTCELINADISAPNANLISFPTKARPNVA